MTTEDRLVLSAPVNSADSRMVSASAAVHKRIDIGILPRGAGGEHARADDGIPTATQRWGLQSKKR